MVFEYILRQNGIDPAKDLEINQNIDFGSTAAAFSEDDSDFTVEFEPHATSLETGGKGHVVASLGTDSGYVPWDFPAFRGYGAGLYSGGKGIVPGGFNLWGFL